MNIDRIVLTTFAGYYYTQILCLRSIQQYAAGFPVDIIIDDFDIEHWPSYPEDCQQYILDNFPDLDITFHKFSDFAGMEQVRTGGWFRQQLVKLYLDRFITGNHWLLVDADVEFLEPPNLDIVSAVVKPEIDSIDAGNRMYIQYLLNCDDPWVVNKNECWCLSAVPFRLIHRDLLEQLRIQISQVHNDNVFYMHLKMFENNTLVAFDPEFKKMVMSEFQLIEVFRHRYYHTPVPILKTSASRFSHSSQKDWEFDRSYFEQKNICVNDREWQLSQTFGKHRV